MRKVTSLFFFGALMAATAASAQQSGALTTAAEALGVHNVRTLQISGAGAAFQVGQNFSVNDPWPPVLLKTFTAAINYDSNSMRLEQVRDLSVPQPRGGGASFSGAEQRQVAVVSGDYAWNVPPAPPAPAGGGAAPAAPAAAPAPGNRLDRMLTLWGTPQGFVKAALANNAITRSVPGGTEVSFMLEGKYRMIGVINAMGQVERVRTWFDHPLTGDTLLETEYSNYYDFGTVVFPTRIVQKQDGYPVFDLTIASAVANRPVDIAVPENVSAAVAPPVNVVSTKLADGVFYLTGGTHHSLAIEMSDHIVLVDTPNNEARALAVIAKAKDVIKNKPIRFVVTSHHHWDHLGGIRAAIDEGAVIVTSESNRAFLERIARAPHTIVPDRLEESKAPLVVQVVGEKGVLADGTRTIELHNLVGYTHANDMLVVYLPKEKILAEPDAFTPPATSTTPLAAGAVPYAQALYDNIQRLKLDVKTIAPFHGARTADMDELARDVGRAAAPPIRSSSN